MLHIIDNIELKLECKFKNRKPNICHKKKIRNLDISPNHTALLATHIYKCTVYNLLEQELRLRWESILAFRLNLNAVFFHLMNYDTAWFVDLWG